MAFAEVDAFPSAVLAHHYPDVPNYGDMTRFQEWPHAVIDVLVGGTPCQSFSVAGLRQGLDDPRGSLLLTYLALAQRARPRWLVWENVPGVLSADNGRAFGSLLGGLAELGYGFAYRVLDAQYFGLAQRRARVFVVGCLGDWRRAAAVLFERESLCGYPAPRRQTGEGITCSPAGIAGSCSRKWSKGTGGPAGDEHYNLIAHSLRADGFDASKDGAGRGTPIVPVTLAIRGRGDSHDLEYRQDGLANAVLTPTGGRGGIGVGAIAFAESQRGEVITSDTMGALKVGGGKPGQGYPAIAFDARQSDVLQYGEKTGPLDTDGHLMAIAFRSDAARSGEAKTPSPDAEGRIRLRDAGFNVYEECAPTLDATAPHGVGYGMQVRRLTPRECERLQGFPDDYTLIPYRGKLAADGPRYKALGNSMAVPVMRWIGARIALVDGIE